MMYTLSRVVAVSLIAFCVSGFLWFHTYWLSLQKPFSPFVHSQLGFNVLRAIRKWDEEAPDSEIAVVGISNCIFMHTPMVPKNLPIFIQLFSHPVKCPPLRVMYLASAMEPAISTLTFHAQGDIFAVQI